MFWGLLPIAKREVALGCMNEEKKVKKRYFEMKKLLLVLVFQIGLAGAGGTHADRDGVFGDEVAVALLPDGFGLDGLALGGDADAVACQLLDFVLAAGVHQRNAVAHVLFAECFAAADELQQALDHGGRLGGKFRLALHLQLAAAAGDAHAELALDQLDIAVKASEQRNGVFHSVDIDDLFRKAGLPRLLSLC